MKKRLLKFILALFVSISPILTITNVLAIDENYEPTVMPSREYEHIDTPITNSNTRSRARSNLQAKYSSVDNGFVTDVKNQGSNGNCWAYAACSVAESYLIKHGMAKILIYQKHILHIICITIREILTVIQMGIELL